MKKRALYMVHARDTTKHPIMHRTAPKNYLAQNGSSVKVKKPGSRGKKSNA